MSYPNQELTEHDIYHKEINKNCEYCCLPFDPKHDGACKRLSEQSMNTKWEEEFDERFDGLTEDENHDIKAFIKDQLRKKYL